MKVFSICMATAIFAAFSHAVPFEAQARQFVATAIFQGAGDASYTLIIEPDGSTFNIRNPLSVSHIKLISNFVCTFNGIDGSVTIINGPGEADVAPPQRQVSARCIPYVD